MVWPANRMVFLMAMMFIRWPKFLKTIIIDENVMLIVLGSVIFNLHLDF